MMDRISDIVSGTREVNQMAIVKDGWGWLYTQDDDLFLDTTKKHIELLCEGFGVTIAKENLFEVYHWETEESFTFEGEKKNLQLLRDYLDGKYEDKEFWVDKKLEKLWEEYYNKCKQYDWVKQEEENDDD